MKFTFNTHFMVGRSRSGFALVLVLIILALLAVVAVGFLASMTAERTTSSAYANRAKAEQAAQAGSDAAIAMLRQAFYQFPDSATVWDPAQVKDFSGATIPGTTLFIRAATDGANASTDPARNCPPTGESSLPPIMRHTYALPLVSGVTDSQPKLASQRAMAVPQLTSDRAVLNFARFKGDNQGWIGTPPPNPASPSTVQAIQNINAAWTDLTDPTSKAVTGRFAFWMEDESFRTNVSYAGAKARGDTTEGKDPSELSMAGFLNVVESASGTHANSIVTARSVYPTGMFPDRMAFAHGLSAASAGYADRVRYLTTTQSGGLNLSRHGSVRLNLNNLLDPTVPENNTNNTTAIGSVQKEVDKIEESISYLLPKFGQRFYNQKSTPTYADWDSLDVSDADAKAYRYRTAANIIDYIDADSQPTLIDTNGRVVVPPSSETTHPIDDPNNSPPSSVGGNPYFAIGKEATPFISEGIAYYTWKPTGLSFTLRADYFIEVWNMSDKDVTPSMLKGATIRVAAQADWSTLTSPGKIQMDDVVIDVSQVTFPAGSSTCISTCPTPPANIPNNSPTAAIKYCPNNAKEYSGTWTGVVSNNNAIYACRVIYGRSTTGSDYKTEIVFSNGSGFLDSITGGVPLYWNGGAYIRFPKKTDLSSLQPDYFGGALLGNSMVPSALGDPRTNQEQLTFQNYNSGSTTNAPDQTRFFNADINSLTPGRPNANYVNPTAGVPWGDYYAFYAPGSTAIQTSTMAANPDKTSAPSVIADAPMTSIGQLGDIFDPARLPSGKQFLGTPQYSRGGGRTFKVGQKDDRVNVTAATGDHLPNPSQEGWASYRLANIFCVTDERNIFLPGLINLNGVARDYGATLRAALDGYKFQPITGVNPLVHGDLKINNADLPAGATQNIVNAVTRRVSPSDGSTPQPFFDRAEFGDVDKFSTGADFTGSANMAQVFDRSREEITRRVLEMTTTRGDVYTAYVVGQSITTQEGNKRVGSTVRLKVTFRLDPVWVDSSTNAAYIPGTYNFDATPKPAGNSQFNPELVKRLKYPSRYDVVVLESSNEIIALPDN